MPDSNGLWRCEQLNASVVEFGRWTFGACCLVLTALTLADEPEIESLADRYPSEVRPLVERYCVGCHSTDETKGEVDLERFPTAESVRGDTRVWQKALRRLEAGEMPPKKNPQPSDDERRRLTTWIEQFLVADARARAGDPGLVLVRRLTNAEYDYTIRDLAGADLHPTRQFPDDSVAGEGFANTGEALIMAPTLLPKYLEAARMVAARAVLTPTGFRFSSDDDPHEWISQSMERIREFYGRYTDAQGRVNFVPYIEATFVLRENSAEVNFLEAIAREQGLSARYLRILWEALNGLQVDSDSPTSSRYAAEIVELAQLWRTLQAGEAAKLVEEVHARQAKRWKFNTEKGFQAYSIGLYGKYVVAVESEADFEEKATTDNDRDVVSFDDLFPFAVCFPDVMPVNNDVTVQLFHREDEPLQRLFLDERGNKELDGLWGEFLMVSRALIDEAYNMREFIEFQPADRHENSDKLAAMLPELDARAEEYKKTIVAAEPKQVDGLIEFAARAWRRPVEAGEEEELRRLYATQRDVATHEEALRTVLARVLVSPRFLYRVERPAVSEGAVEVNDWELATRLSYFLWSSLPDAELRAAAAVGLQESDQLRAQQARRMLQDPRAQALAVEFAAQWLQIRGFGTYEGKSESRFPTFTPGLRRALDEEATRFIHELIENDRSVLDILYADHTFLNAELAEHYGIPFTPGGDSEWRRVDGVGRYGRGGVLAMGSVLAKQSGALRSSPVLRGTWVVDTLLGRELPNPPAEVPQLAEDEVNAEGLTMREIVERHREDPNCSGCHNKIDPYGFALEAYDPIGRLREKDLNGNRIDTRAELQDGRSFEGLGGLQGYLRKHEAEYLRQFCRKLLGYALGRTVELSDAPLLEEMNAALKRNEYRFSAAVLTIVESSQFRQHRGRRVASSE